MFYTIGHLQIPQRRILDTPLNYLELNNKDGIRKIFKEMKELTGYKYDNMHLKWSNIYGHMFALSVYYSKSSETWDIQLWDHTGQKTVIRVEQDVEDKETDVLSEENYKKISNASMRFVRGKILCSGCGTEIDKDDVAGTYFAGSFCEDCWESKYKAIEAKETYS